MEMWLQGDLLTERRLGGSREEINVQMLEAKEAFDRANHQMFYMKQTTQVRYRCR